jgi:tRNA(adenine34) deaminase
MFSARDHDWMQHALTLALLAEKLGEVPVGAVLVLNDVNIGEGFNRPISNQDPTAHAEIIALRHASKKIGNYRVLDSTLYVTLEPCIMCLGALIHARVKRVVYAATDARVGAAARLSEWVTPDKLNHALECEGGLLEVECSKMLGDFFRKKREQK